MAESEKSKSGLQGFVEGLKAEFRKIVWPNQEKLTKQTITVVSVSLVLGLLIAVLDWLFQFGLTSVFH